MRTGTRVRVQPEHDYVKRTVTRLTKLEKPAVLVILTTALRPRVEEFKDKILKETSYALRVTQLGDSHLRVVCEADTYAKVEAAVVSVLSEMG